MSRPAATVALLLLAVLAVASAAAGQNVYSASEDGTVRKIDSGGSQLWSFSGTGAGNKFFTVAVDADGFVYAGDEKGNVFKIDATGSQVWRFGIAGQPQVNSVKADGSGNVYAGTGDGRVFKIDGDGNEVWSVTPAGGSSIVGVAVDRDHNVYAGTGTPSLVKLDSAGTTVWTYTNFGGTVETVAPGLDGNVYTGDQNAKVTKIDTKGSLVWQFSGHSSTVRDVVFDEFAYSGSDDLTVKKIDDAGPSEVWSFTDPGGKKAVDIAVDRDANVYYGTDGAQVRKLSSDGASLVWTFTGHTAVVTSVTVDPGEFNLATDDIPPTVSSITTLDRDGDGKVDAANVVFSEHIDDSSITPSDWSIGGVPVEAVVTTVGSDSDVDDDRVQLQIHTDANEVAGTEAKDVTYTQGTTADVAGNLLADVASADVAEADGARPTIVDLEIFDTDSDGRIDEVVVSFSETIDTDDGAAPVVADLGTLTLPDGSTADLSGATFTDPAGTSSTVTITGIAGQTSANTAAGSTGIDGDLSAHWVDGSGNALVSTLDDETVTDSAAPAQVGVAYKDTNGDGQVDRIDITYSEPLAGTAEAGDYSLGGTDAGSVSLDSATVSGSTVQLGVTGPAEDTLLDLEVSYDRTAGTADSLRDGAGNAAASFAGVAAADEAPPVVLYILTRDTDGDGKTDAADITFSEPILDSTVTPDDWTIGGVAAEAVSTTVSGDADPDDDTVRLLITTDANEVPGTDAKDVTYTRDAPTDADVTDHAGNLLADVARGDIAETSNDPPEAVDDDTTTDEDTAVTVAVLANDADLQGDPLTLESVGTPSNGAVSINADDTVTYTPNPDFNGGDTFTYTVSDGGGTDTGNVSVTVNPVNDAPAAGDDAATTDEDTAVTVTVLSNDGDVDGDTLEVTAVGTPSHGVAVVNADDTITYTPDADYNGADSFTYTVSDGALTDTATADVTVKPVNDAPAAGDDAAATDEDTAVTVTVLSNDGDVDGDTLDVTGATDPANGAVTVNVDDTITYTPDPDYDGADSFTYTVSDGGLADTATVSITVDPVNDAPVAGDDVATVEQDGSVTVAVLANDEDVDGDALDVTGATDPANGAVTVNADDTVTYTPDPGYTGSDSFTYNASDGVLADTATVDVTVVEFNNPPNANDDTATTNEDTAVTIDVLANDDDPDGTSLTVASATDPAEGTATINPDDTITYTPDPDVHGDDSFTYTATDGAKTDTATVNVTVNSVADAPVADDDAAATDEDVAVTVDVLANDDDADGDALAVASVGPAGNGEATLDANDTITYTPSAHFHGNDSFTYTVTDGSLTDAATVSVTVAPVNDAPAAADDVASTDEGVAVTVTVLANDVDVDGDTLSVTGATAPSNGQATVNANDTVTYTPDAGFAGTDSFTYTVSDGTLTSTATVNVTVSSTGGGGGGGGGGTPNELATDQTRRLSVTHHPLTATLSWTRLDPAAGYQLWRSLPDSKIWRLVATVPAHVREFTAERPGPEGLPHHYKLTWIFEWGGRTHLREGSDPSRLFGWDHDEYVRVNPHVPIPPPPKPDPGPPDDDSGLPPGVDDHDATGTLEAIHNTDGRTATLRWTAVPDAGGYQVWRYVGDGGDVASFASHGVPWTHVATIDGWNATFLDVDRPPAGEDPDRFKVTWFTARNGTGYVPPGGDPRGIPGWNDLTSTSVQPASRDTTNPPGGDGPPPGGSTFSPWTDDWDWSLWWLAVLATATATVGVYAASRRR